MKKAYKNVLIYKSTLLIFYSKIVKKLVKNYKNIIININSIISSLADNKYIANYTM
jgi:hypothetical protein